MTDKLLFMLGYAMGIILEVSTKEEYQNDKRIRWLIESVEEVVYKGEDLNTDKAP